MLRNPNFWKRRDALAEDLVVVPFPVSSPFLAVPWNLCWASLYLYSKATVRTSHSAQNVDERTEGDRAGAQGIGLPRHRPLQNPIQDSYRLFSMCIARVI